MLLPNIPQIIIEPVNRIIDVAVLHIGINAPGIRHLQVIFTKHVEIFFEAIAAIPLKILGICTHVLRPDYLTKVAAIIFIVASAKGKSVGVIIIIQRIRCPVKVIIQPLAHHHIGFGSSLRSGHSVVVVILVILVILVISATIGVMKGRVHVQVFAELMREMQLIMILLIVIDLMIIGIKIIGACIRIHQIIVTNLIFAFRMRVPQPMVQVALHFRRIVIQLGRRHPVPGLISFLEARKDIHFQDSILGVIPTRNKERLQIGASPVDKTIRSNLRQTNIESKLSEQSGTRGNRVFKRGIRSGRASHFGIRRLIQRRGLQVDGGPKCGSPIGRSSHPTLYLDIVDRAGQIGNIHKPGPVRLGIVHRHTVYRYIDAVQVGTANAEIGVPHSCPGIRCGHIRGGHGQQVRNILPHVTTLDRSLVDRCFSYRRFVASPGGRHQHLVGQHASGFQFNQQINRLLEFYGDTLFLVTDKRNLQFVIAGFQFAE